MVITVTAVTIPQMYEETATLERTPCFLYRLRRTGNLGNFSKKGHFLGEKPSFPTILRTFTPEQERPWPNSVKKIRTVTIREGIISRLPTPCRVWRVTHEATQGGVWVGKLVQDIIRRLLDAKFETHRNLENYGHPVLSEATVDVPGVNTSIPWRSCKHSMRQPWCMGWFI